MYPAINGDAWDEMVDTIADHEALHGSTLCQSIQQNLHRYPEAPFHKWALSATSTITHSATWVLAQLNPFEYPEYDKDGLAVTLPLTPASLTALPSGEIFKHIDQYVEAGTEKAGDQHAQPSYHQQLWIKVMTLNGLTAIFKRWKTWTAQMAKHEVTIGCLQECRHKKQGTFTSGKFLVHRSQRDKSTLGCQIKEWPPSLHHCRHIKHPTC